MRSRTAAICAIRGSGGPTRRRRGWPFADANVKPLLGPARMMTMNSAKSTSPSLSMSAAIIISSTVLSSRPYSYVLRMHPIISSASILPLLSMSILAKAASSPASDLSMPSPKWTDVLCLADTGRPESRS